MSKIASTRQGQVFSGVFLVGLGIVAFLNFWWPGIMFVVGIALLARERTAGKELSFSNGSIVAALVVLLIGLFGWLNFDFGNTLPLVLILLGLYLLYGERLRTPAVREEFRENNRVKQKSVV